MTAAGSSWLVYRYIGLLWPGGIDGFPFGVVFLSSSRTRASNPFDTTC